MATRYRTSAEADRLIIVNLHVAARRFAAAVDLDDSLRETSVAALKKITERPDLLAEEAGICIAFGERTAGELLTAAGADREAIPAWVEEGERRRDKRPHSAP